MYKKRFAIAILIVVGCLSSLPVFASVYIKCDGCTEMQMEQAALAQGVGRYVVGNITSSDVEALRVYRSTAPEIAGRANVSKGPVPTRLYVDDGGITAAETSAFNDFVTFYNIAPVGYDKQYDLVITSVGPPPVAPEYANSNPMLSKNPRFSPMGLPVGGGNLSYPYSGVNAYSVLPGGPAQNQLLTWVSEQSEFEVQNVASLGGHIASMFNLMNQQALFTVAFNITFIDGSRISVYVDITQNPPSLEVNNNSAVDSHGNDIPASYAAIAGKGQKSYNFSTPGTPSDIVNMQQILMDYGVGIPEESDQWICTSFPIGLGGGVEVRCTIY